MLVGIRGTSRPYGALWATKGHHGPWLKPGLGVLIRRVAHFFPEGIALVLGSRQTPISLNQPLGAHTVP